MIILGINAYHADSSAAIFVNGKLIAAIEEERFQRVKHWAGFPAKAIEFCLNEVGIQIEQVDHIAIGRDPKAKFLKKLLFMAGNPAGSFKVVKDRFQNARNVTSLETEFEKHFNVLANTIKPKIYQVEHHRSHLASAFFASPFKRAALLSIDGSGDFTTTMTGIGDDNNMAVLDSVDFPHSVGLFYTSFTQFLGFPNYGDEYKVMGLAPYGEPKYIDKLSKVIHLQNDGLFRLDLSYFVSATEGMVTYGEADVPQVHQLFNGKVESEFGAARKSKQPITQYHKDMAASIQQITENVIFHILHHLHKKTNIDTVCIAGGVAQNSVANGKIIQNTPFKNVYIPSAGHDAGISMGAGLYVQHQVKQYPRQCAILSAYTGSSYSNEEIENLLVARKISYRRLEDEQLYNVVSERLINAGVVGWFNGKAEFGPRALGARSILADPRRNDAKDLLNDKIKRRESFRPFAPSILKEHVKDFFEIDDAVPFMEKVFRIKSEKQASVPAVTHVDGTGRLQSVDRDVSPKFYRLIEAFFNKTGIPILLNTSFNENEPIVNSPEQALNCFLRTQMDMLVLENIVVER
jgi:carbamoyltransferase